MGAIKYGGGSLVFRYGNFSDVSILLTQKCDKGCTFCCVDARPRREIHLPFNYLIKFKEEVSSLEIPIERIALTGGEAFLYRDGDQDILDVFRLLGEIPTDHISVQTSGWSEKTPEFEGQIEALSHAESDLRHRIRFSSSYNLYQRRGIQERMAKTISLITDNFSFIHLQNAFDPSNMAETVSSFAALMRELGFEGPKEDTIEARIRHKEWIHRDGDKCVVAHFYPAYQVGRGEKTLKSVFTREKQGCPIHDGCRRWLTIDWDGSVKICNSIASWASNPKFGHLKEGLSAISDAHDTEVEFVKTRILSVDLETIKVAGFQSICQFCAMARSRREVSTTGNMKIPMMIYNHTTEHLRR